MEFDPFPHTRMGTLIPEGVPTEREGAGGAERLVAHLPEDSPWVGTVDRPMFTSWVNRANLGEVWWVGSATPSNQGSERSAFVEEMREGAPTELSPVATEALAPPSGDRQTGDFSLSPNFPQDWFLG